MKKRIAAIVLAGLLAVSVLGAGCGKNEAEDKDTQKKTEAGVDGTEKTKDRKEQTVVKPVKKPDTSGDGEQEDASPKKEEGQMPNPAREYPGSRNTIPGRKRLDR